MTASDGFPVLPSTPRFINARRRILQPMLDSSCSETPKTKKKTAQNRPVQRFWPDSIASGAAQPPPSELAMSEGGPRGAGGRARGRGGAGQGRSPELQLWTAAVLTLSAEPRDRGLESQLCSVPLSPLCVSLPSGFSAQQGAVPASSPAVLPFFLFLTVG